MRRCTGSVDHRRPIVRSARRLLLAVALVVPLTACRGDARLMVGIESLPATLGTAEVHYRIVTGSRAWSVTFPVGPGGTPTPQRSKEFDMPTSGNAVISFTITEAHREVAAGAVTVPLHDDNRVSVGLITRTVDPRLQEHCFGCSAATTKAFALPPELRAHGADSLWLVWAGNSIKNPVVY